MTGIFDLLEVIARINIAKADELVLARQDRGYKYYVKQSFVDRS